MVEESGVARWRKKTHRLWEPSSILVQEGGGRHSVAAVLHAFEIWTDKTSWIILLSYVLNSLLCGTRSP